AQHLPHGARRAGHRHRALHGDHAGVRMTTLDWLVLGGTIAAIVGWGIWKTCGASTSSDYLRGGYELCWHIIGLSVMATQASAITFLSVPGQAYEDGMRFVQFYFGLPIAMIII